MERDIKILTEHSDIVFLRLRMKQLIEEEQYERCIIIQKWIDELIILHNEKSKI